MINHLSDSLSKHLRNQRGFSLIELLTALIITGIVASSFLGVMVHFAKLNQKSRTILLATAAANNQYERMKSFSLYELAQFPASQIVHEGNFIVTTEMERFYPNTSIGPAGSDASNTAGLDLAIEGSSEEGFFSYLTAGHLQDLVSLTGNGLLQVDLIPEDNGILVQMSDEDGKTAAFHFITSSHSHTINIYTQQMSKDQQVQIEFDPSLPGEWKVNVYEPPFPLGKVLFCYKDAVCQTDQGMKRIDLDNNITIQTFKREGKSSTLVYLQVRAYTDPADSKPVSSCQGVIKIPY
jgi:prepilin-type N-terminal cleavage/methylation domain-containing protein